MGHGSQVVRPFAVGEMPAAQKAHYTARPFLEPSFPAAPLGFAMHSLPGGGPQHEHRP